MSIKNKKWFLIYTKPKLEKVAAKHLNNIGFETFLPLILQKQNCEAMFPRYLFIKFDALNDNWTPIKSTIGVSNLVFFGGHFSSVPQDIIKSIKSNLDKNNILKQDLLTREYNKGESLVINEGKFSGRTAIYLSKSGKERVNILLKILGKYAHTQLSSAEVGKKRLF